MLRDTGSIPGLGRSPGGGHGNPLQHSCLENPMDRGAWWVTVHGVTESDTTEATRHGNAARGLGSIPARGTKIPQTMRCSHQKKKKKSTTHPHLFSVNGKEWKQRDEGCREGFRHKRVSGLRAWLRTVAEGIGRGELFLESTTHWMYGMWQ